MTRNYVTFEQAVYLKSKKFNEICSKYYFRDNSGDYYLSTSNTNDKWNDYGIPYSAPEHWQVIQWLWEIWGIWISVITDSNYKFFFILNNSIFKTTTESKEKYDSPEEAYSAAFDKLFFPSPEE